jgi:membrane-associated PAP2 superfamily phosphatase
MKHNSRRISHSSNNNNNNYPILRKHHQQVKLLIVHIKSKTLLIQSAIILLLQTMDKIRLRTMASHKIVLESQIVSVGQIVITLIKLRF